MIRGVYLNGMVDDWNDCFEIRKTVFQDELGERIEKDEKDEMAIQLLLYDENEKPVASARLIFDIDGIFEFDYLAVLPSGRKNGYADFLMHMIFDKANLCGAKYLASDDISNSPEYFKKYGFEITDGRMILNLKNYFDQHKCCH